MSADPGMDAITDYLREQAAEQLRTPDDWHRIRDEHRDEPILDRMRRERATFDRTVRARGDYSVPSDPTSFEQQLADEARPSAFGPVRESASEVPLKFFYGVPDEGATSAGAFREGWQPWQDEVAAKIFASYASADWLRNVMFGGHQPGEERAEQPDPGDKKPEQRVWDGPFPTELHFAGVVGRPMVITERDLMEEQDLPEQLEHFQHVASIHAPWVEIRSMSYPQHPIEIGYVRPSLTSLPA